jgi:predicted RNA-binding Zn ribbon-like protein
MANSDGTRIDFWRTDEDVTRWLVRTGWLDETASIPVVEGSLVDTARELREIVRDLVLKRKRGERGYPDALNAYLREALSYPWLVWDSATDIQVIRQRPQQTAKQLLAPLAEASAELLATGDFTLIRACEHPECCLWFYDRTKSHKRRWCSMTLCGNRHKVAEFRKRQSGYDEHSDKE